METENRALIDDLRMETSAGFAGVTSRFSSVDATLVSMNATLAGMNATLTGMNAMLVRHDRWFGVLHVQHMEFRSEVEKQLAALSTDLSGSRSDFHRFRDWAGGQFVEVKSAIDDLTRRFETTG